MTAIAVVINLARMDRQEAYATLLHVLRVKRGETLYNAARRRRLRGSTVRRHVARMVLEIDPRDPWPGMFRAAAFAAAGVSTVDRG